MAACLVRFLCSVFPGFNWFLGPIGLVDAGVGPGFALFGLSRALFSIFGVPNWNLSRFSPTLVRRFGGLSVSVGVWYWIWSPFMGGR